MKKIFSLVFLCGIVAASYGQSTYSMTSQPSSNITTSDEISIIVGITFPGPTCDSVSSTIDSTTTPGQITITGYYCYQTVGTACNNVSTYSIGTLPAGTWTVSFYLSTNNTAAACGSYSLKDIDNLTLTVGQATGVSNIASGKQVMIYPNPVSNSMMFSFEIENQTDVEIVLYDIAGAKVKSLILSEQKTGLVNATLDISGLAPNIYFYTIKSFSGTAVGKLAVSR